VWQEAAAVLDHLDGATRLYYVVGDSIAQVKAPARMTRGFAQRRAPEVHCKSQWTALRSLYGRGRAAAVS
jgi:hypothetical protein